MLTVGNKMETYIRDYSNKIDEIMNKSFATLLLPFRIVFALTIFTTFLFLLIFIIF